MPIHYTTGDALVPVKDGVCLIPHIVNNKGGWGAGFVVAISKLTSLPEKYYRQWSTGEYPNNWVAITHEEFELGSNQYVIVSPNVQIVNMCAQNGYKTAENPVPVDYVALRMCMRDVFSSALAFDAYIQMPRIGCGLGGGDWNVVEGILNGLLRRNDVDVYVVDLP